MKALSDIKYLRKAWNTEHYLLYVGILKCLTKEFIEKYQLTSFYDDLEKAFEVEDAAFVANKAYEVTGSLNSLETDCDRHYRSFSLSIRSKLLSANPSIQEAAAKINYRLEPYKNSLKKARSDKAANMFDLLKVLMSEECAEYIETLGETEALASFKTAVDKLMQAISVKNVEKLNRKNSDNMKAARPAVDAAFETLATMINSLYLVSTYIEKDNEKSAEIEAVIDAINAQILGYATKLSDRNIGKSKKDSSKPKPDDSKPTPDQSTPDQDTPTTDPEKPSTDPDDSTTKPEEPSTEPEEPTTEPEEPDDEDYNDGGSPSVV